MIKKWYLAVLIQFGFPMSMHAVDDTAGNQADQQIVRLCTLPFFASILDGIDTIIATESACCSAIDLQLGVVHGQILDTITAEQAVASALDVCSSTLQAELITIASKIDQVPAGSCDIVPLLSAIGACGSRLDSQVQVIESKIDALPMASVDLSPLSSSLASCCSALDTQLTAVRGQLQQEQSVMESVENRINQAASVIETQLHALNTEIATQQTAVQAIVSNLDVCASSIETNVVSLDDLLAQNLSQAESIASSVDACGSTIETDLGALNAQSAQNQTITQQILSELDVCCSSIENQLVNLSMQEQQQLNLMQGVASKLDDCCSTIDTQLQADYIQAQQLQSVSQGVSSTLDICCSSLESQVGVLQSQVMQNQSVMQGVASEMGICCSSIESQLDLLNAQEIQVQQTNQASASKLDWYCSAVESQLAGIGTQMMNNQSAMQGVESKLDTCCSVIESQLNTINGLFSCAYTSVSSATVLSNPGVYCLGSDALGTFTVSGSNITFDLNSHTISGGLYGLEIAGNHVTVLNGTIQNAAGADILLTGSQCTVESCNLLSSPTGLHMENACYNRILGCRALNNGQAGFSLLSSYTNIIADCMVLNSNGAQDTYGFYSAFGSQNTFKRCLAQGITAHGGQAIGYGIYGETGDKLYDDKAFSILSSTTAFALGLLLGMNCLPTITVLTTQYYNTNVYAVQWSYDGKYLAAGGSNSFGSPGPVQVYAFDGATLSLVASQTINSSTSSTIGSLNWSPNGQYLAVGDYLGGLQIFAFNRTNLTAITNQQFGSIGRNDIKWSPDGRYLAVGAILSDFSTNAILVYAFTGTALVTVANAGLVDAPDYIFGVDWSPDGNYLVAQSYAGAIGIYAFNGIQLTRVTMINPGSILLDVRWSPLGRYIASVGSFTSGDSLQVYAFDGSQLTLVKGITPDTQCLSVDWAPDGHYVAVGTSFLNELQIYAFDGISLNLVQNNAGGGPSTLSWSANGKYLAGGVSSLITAYGILAGCNQCLIKNNTACGVQNSAGMGTSYVANASANLVVNNDASGNNVNYTMTSQTNPYGDYKYMQTLAAAIWAKG